MKQSPQSSDRVTWKGRAVAGLGVSTKTFRFACRSRPRPILVSRTAALTSASNARFSYCTYPSLHSRRAALILERHLLYRSDFADGGGEGRIALHSVNTVLSSPSSISPHVEQTIPCHKAFIILMTRVMGRLRTEPVSSYRL